jgi:histidinol-phosphate/aromatic aminotransferase/cobyric acid decarboxylase-like protein
MKQIALKDHLENRLRELKEERRRLKNQKLRSVKESNDIKFILAKFKEERKHG